MAAPGRSLICQVTATLLLLAGSPGLLEAALARVRPHCCCPPVLLAHAGQAPEYVHECHCHHHDDADENANEDDPTGDGAVTDDHTHCPCCPLRPRGSCGGCCLVKAPFFTVT